MSKVVTGDVEILFPHVFEPYSFNNEEPKYSVRLLIPKTAEDEVKKLQKAIDEAIEEKGIEKFGPKYKREMLTLPLRDGDAESDDDGNPRHPGMIFCNARSSRKPGVVDRRKNVITEDADGSFLFSGCIARVYLSVFCYNAMGKKGVALGLEALQKIRDGEGGGSAINMFEDLGEDPDVKKTEENDELPF